jgi:hypothetical protein
VDFAPLKPGTLTAHSVKGTGLVLENESGQPVTNFRRGTEPYSAVLEAADGTWTMQGADVSKWKGPERYVVTDAAGTEVATLEKGRTERSMTLPSGSVTWEYHAVKSPHYRVEGLFSADRRAAQKFVPGLTKKPFTVDVNDALVARSDGSLLLLLAAWCTNDHVESKVDSG